jgi:hypothetical protein
LEVGNQSRPSEARQMAGQHIPWHSAVLMPSGHAEGTRTESRDLAPVEGIEIGPGKQLTWFLLVLPWFDTDDLLVQQHQQMSADREI